MAVPDTEISRTQRAVELSVLLGLLLLFLIVSMWVEAPATAKRLGVILGAGFTLVMYSFLYRDNPLFKIAENLYVGVALGYGAILTWRLSLKPEVVSPLLIDPPHWHAFWVELGQRAAPIILGLLLLTRLSRRYAWLSRYAYTLMVGWGAGIGIPIAAHSMILKQLQAAVRPLGAAAGTGADVWQAASAVVGGLAILVGTVTVLFYFFFSVEHKGVAGGVSRVGVWFLMISFGASFGYTVMGRVSLLIGRVQFLIYDWLQVPK
ncbi:MAG: hypothetical protein ACODAJ_12300 [Planctomycetota bacterium]